MTATITRVIYGHELTIQLTDEEVRRICNEAKLEEDTWTDERSFLVDLLESLAGPEEMLRGVDLDDILTDEALLREISREWQHLNGHGPDQHINLELALDKVFEARCLTQK